MKTTRLDQSIKYPLVAGMVAAAAVVSAGPVEQVNLAGTGIGGHTTIDSAIAAVDPGGVVEIIEAGVYGNATLIGGKSYTIDATVAGVVSPGTGVSGGWSVDATAGNVNVTISDLTLSRDTGSGPAFDIDQHATNTITITLDNMTVEHLLAASGGEAVKFDDGAAGAAVSLTATDTTFSSAVTSGSGKSAIRVQSDTSTNFAPLTIDLTDCTLTANNEGTIRVDSDALGPLPNFSLTMDGCTVNNPFDKGIEIDDGIANSTITITDTTITANEEGIVCSDDGDNNAWLIERCTVDNSTNPPGDNDRCIRIDHNTSLGNTVTVQNCLILTALASNNRGIEIEGVGNGAAVGEFHHNTIAAVGGAAAPGAGRGITSGSSGSYNFSNNILINFADPISGSTGTKSGNVIAGASDDGSAGTPHIYANVADYPAAMTALALDPSYIPTGLPGPTSPLSYGDPATNVGAVDRLNLPRPYPVGSNPDSGCFESQTALPLTVDSFFID